MGIGDAYRETAEELGRTLAHCGIGLIYGGSKAGLMGAVAAACLGAGGTVVGVIPEVLVDKEIAHDGLTELHVTSTMHTRKALMAERANAFLILPGGFGTMEEMFEVLAWQTLDLHRKPIVLINVAGFTTLCSPGSTTPSKPACCAPKAASSCRRRAAWMRRSGWPGSPDPPAKKHAWATSPLRNASLFVAKKKRRGEIYGRTRDRVGPAANH